ncbi:PIR protein [Plasmodium ovale]|uniref:PIR protein n=1 Tax=Plasmodium ovale TaxID=36330 RepID=A0A1D3JCH5_PLAOA|nr:PIR protein [Plasmodium ovale]
MSEDIVAKALKLLERDGEPQKNPDLHKFYEDLSSSIKNAYATYDKCKKENAKVESSTAKVTCSIGENEVSLDTYLERIKSANIPAINGCDYLLCWMSDKIDECKNNAYCIIKLHNMFSKLWQDSGCCNKNSENNENCKKTFVMEFDKKIIKNKKELYIFLKYYDKIENTLKKDESEKKETYCKYVKYIFDLYSFMDNEVNEYVHKKYKKALEDFKNAFKSENNLSILKSVCNYPNLFAKSQIEENNRNLALQTNFDRFIPHLSDFSTYVIQTPSDDILGNTPSYKLYKEFDNEGTDETLNGYCDNYFDKEKTYKEERIKICKKILNNFKKLYDIESTLTSSERCLHYKNWVYKEIWELINDKSDYENSQDIIHKFLQIQKEKNRYNNDKKYLCYYYFIFKDFTELNAKREEKDLQDYFKYHDTIERNVNIKNNKDKYVTYLTYIKKLYKRHMEDWNCCDASSGVNPLCRHYFKCEEEYHPNYLMSILDGKIDESYLQKRKTFPVVIIGEKDPPTGTEGNDVMRIQYGRCTYVSDPYNKEKAFAMKCDYKASPKHFENIYKNLPDEKKKVASQPVSSTDSLEVNINDISGIPYERGNESNPIYYKIPMSVALGLGSVLIFFLYYRFTPFGSLFGKKSRGITSFEDDFNEEYMQQFSHDSEYEDLKPRNRRIQIAYQRM